MSFEDFQLLDNERFDNSIMKRDFLKVYHQQGAQLNDPDQNIEFIFGENNNYHQVGNAYLEFDITVSNPTPSPPVFDDNSPIRLTNNGFSYVFKETRLSTSTADLEHNKYVGQISTIMRIVSSRDGDLLSQFDNIDEKLGDDEHATTAIIQDTSLHKMLIANHENDTNRGEI